MPKAHNKKKSSKKRKSGKKNQKIAPLPEPQRNYRTSLSIHYDSGRRLFLIENDRKEWIPVNETSARRALKNVGVSDRVNGNGLSDVDKAILDTITSYDVFYAAALAGYDAGQYLVNQRRILVTSSPHFIEPLGGDFPLIKQILEGMFCLPDIDQRPYVYGWLKVAITALRAREWQPGQVLALAGPVNSAKSLFQKLVTLMLGGRSAQPYLYLSGGSVFNSDLFTAEHLAVEDAAESTHISKRRHFGAMIKSVAVNHEHQCHRKNCEALTLTPFWRMTISLNDDPERLLVLPPLDGDILDKVSLLKVQNREMPMPTRSVAQRKLFLNALQAELPYFIKFLLDWEIPEDLRSERFGVTHYHHPELLLALEQSSPEVQLLDLIDEKYFSPELYRVAGDEWVGKANTLYTDLTEDVGAIGRQATKLLYSAVACGNYLSRLVQKGERVTSRRINGYTEYTVRRPH